MTATIARTMDEHVVIVGAGPAGLAAAWAIRRAGHDPLVVEQADVVAASWRGRHDHLRLNTHRRSRISRVRVSRAAAARTLSAMTTWPTCRNTPRECGCG
jgi:cation diffusion facilitator CzcD-associated flavoprotein CzcO